MVTIDITAPSDQGAGFVWVVVGVRVTSNSDCTVAIMASICSSLFGMRGMRFNMSTKTLSPGTHRHQLEVRYPLIPSYLIFRLALG